MTAREYRHVLIIVRSQKAFGFYPKDMLKPLVLAVALALLAAWGPGALCGARQRVVTFGTAEGPGFSRVTGKLSIKCPMNAPFALGRGHVRKL